MCLFWLNVSNALSSQEQKHYLEVSENDVSEAIKKEFVEQGRLETVDLEFFGGKTYFQIEGAQTVKILAEKLKTDEQNHKFSVKVEIFADGESFAKTEISGKYFILGDVYVPARNIDKGEVITAEMLKTITVRLNRVKAMFVVEKDKLVNKEAKRYLKAGKIVSDRDIGDKVLIKKNDLITLVYKTKQMQITARGVALQDGTLGERIEVENSKSRKVLMGKVVDAETVWVEAQ